MVGEGQLLPTPEESEAIMARPIVRTVSGVDNTTGAIPLNAVYDAPITVTKSGSGTVKLQATLENIFTEYDPAETLTINIAIDAEGTPDTFSWGTGSSFTSGAEGVEISTTNDLGNGVILTFAATTGHTDTETWSFTVTPTVKSSITFTGTGLNDLTAAGHTDGGVAWFEVESASAFATANWIVTLGGPYTAIRAVSTAAAESVVTVLQAGA